MRERRRERGEALFLVVADLEDDRALGAVWLWNVDVLNGRGEVGYWLLREARGRGAATRAVRLVVGYAFGRWDSSGSSCSRSPGTRPPSGSPSAPASSARACCARTGAGRAAAST